MKQNKKSFITYVLSALMLFAISACTASQTSTETPGNEIPTQASTEDQVIRPTITSPGLPAGTLSPTDLTQTEVAEETALPQETALPPGSPILLIASETNKLMFQDLAPLIQEAGIDTFRYNGLVWSNVEKTEGERDWSRVSRLENKLKEAASLGLQTILIVRGTPEWAQRIPGYFCGPISEDKLQAFGDFLSEAVSRYSQPPYNVKYWELWNEPDVDARLVKFESVFGCWGDSNDPYYGGEYFAEMLKAAYPAIKAADPDAQVLLGGLLLDCDPTHPPQGEQCLPGKFFEGVLNNGGGDYFDQVSFHGYANYSGPSTGNPPLYLDEHQPKWEQRGGVVLGKVDFLREVMASYGIDKPIFHTEGSLICPGANKTDCDPPAAEFYEAQADYVVWVYIRNWAAGLSGTVWYPFEGPGWRFAALLDENQNPKPAHRALRFLTQELRGAGYVKPLEEISPLVGYEFSSEDKKIWVVWSEDGLAYPIEITADILAIFDKYGNPVDMASGQVKINSPVYIELNP